jgi:hypothetical protein
LIEKVFENGRKKKTLQKKENKIASMDICTYTYILYKIKIINRPYLYIILK